MLSDKQQKHLIHPENADLHVQSVLFPLSTLWDDYRESNAFETDGDSKNQGDNPFPKRHHLNIFSILLINPAVDA